ncbi:hypothetical protein QE152_g19539 [Popillia japonica]|uniref:Uncharacterized protein n=1 Tax=Popillia japonica TaxID=7064 RepID=A0AAW1KSY8_POPJA
MADDDWDVVNMVVSNTIRYQRLTADEKRKADAICQAYIHNEMSDSDDPFDDDADETDLTYRPEHHEDDVEIGANVEIDSDQFDENDDDQINMICEEASAIVALPYSESDAAHFASKNDRTWYKDPPPSSRMCS